MLVHVRNYADSVRAAYALAAMGQPEEQLKRPTAAFLERAGEQLGFEVDTTPEIVVSDGRPDIGVLVAGFLCGFVELKAPGETVHPDRMRGRNRTQWKKFQALPNLIYTNSREWRLYQNGELIATANFDEEPRESGGSRVSSETTQRFTHLLTAFFSWRPIVPAQPRELARFLAPLTRVLRADVAEAVRRNSDSLLALRDEWRAYLFADVENAEFADAYAQTIVFALLLARLEGAEEATLSAAETALGEHNSLLGRILRILTQDEVREDIRLGLSIIQRAIWAIDGDALRRQASNIWIYFYEDFLHAYDPKLAKDAGVYYTPAAVVKCQVRLVSLVLEQRFGRVYSYADEGVTTLDPAVGTGTYLVAAIQKAMEVVETRAGAQRPSRAAILARNLVGFELLVGPYAVAHLRLSRELVSAAGGAASSNPFQNQPLRVYLSDTLESPRPPGAGSLIPLSHRPLVAERENARRVKADEHVLVCIGNPPYDRQMDEGAARKGGWVRFGDGSQETPILEDFLEPARRAGEGVNIRSIYNDYVYFWRWALWKVFESRPESPQASGVVCLITGSSYLGGPGFVGMREHMRRCFDELWIIDLGGDSLGTRREPNVFAIQTPVAIAIGVSSSERDMNTPAAVHYHRIGGSRAEKFQQLDELVDFTSVEWRLCPSGWTDPFRPALEGDYAGWPALGQLFPWRHNGAQFTRTWPIAPTVELLDRRWRTLLQGTEIQRRRRLKESRDRTIDWHSDSNAIPGTQQPSIMNLDANAPPPTAIRYAYRSFDRQWALYDARLGDYIKPVIWSAHGASQIYLTTLLATAIGYGPAATISSDIPDLHHFRGSFGGKDLIPLYRDRDAREANITTGLLDILSSAYQFSVEPQDLFLYTSGILCARAFVARFWSELATPGVRVPITRNPTLFREAVGLGRSFVRLHTFGERFRPNGEDAV